MIWQKKLEESICTIAELGEYIELTPKERKRLRKVMERHVIESLKVYINTHNSENWLFLKRMDRGHSTTRTVQKIFGDAVKKVGVGKDVSIHSLRHSFAMHLLESGAGGKR